MPLAPIVIVIIVNVVISVALALISYLLAPKPKKPNFNIDIPERDRTLNVTQPITPRSIIYGEVRVGGPRTTVQSWQNNEKLTVIIPVAGHECEAIDVVWINEHPIYPNMMDGSGNVNSGIYSGLVNIQIELGTDPQAANAYLLANVPDWSSQHQGVGVAYIAATLTWDVDAWPGGVPNIAGTVMGRKVLDTRDSVTRYSLNPAMCIRDYMTNDVFGLNVASADIDDTLLQAAANVSEEVVTVKNDGSNAEQAFDVVTASDCIRFDSDLLRFQRGDQVRISSSDTNPAGLSAGVDYYAIPYKVGRSVNAAGATVEYPALRFAQTYDDAVAASWDAMDLSPSLHVGITSAGVGTITVTRVGEPRYTMSGDVLTDREPHSILSEMLTAMSGKMIFAGGSWNLYGGDWRAPTISFDESDMRGPIRINTKFSRRDRFNAVKGIYTTPLNFGQPQDYPSISSDTFKSQDNGRRLWREFDVPFTSRAQTAQRIAQIQLLASRQEITVEVPLKLSGLKVRAGDNINLSFSDFGWTNKAFEIIEWRLVADTDGDVPYIGVDLRLQETDSTIFDFDEAALENPVDPASNSNLPSPQFVQNPTSLSVTSGDAELDSRADGTIFSRAKLSWIAPADFYVTSGGRINIQYKKTADSAWRNAPDVAGDATEAYILDLADGVSYDFRIRSENALGIHKRDGDGNAVWDEATHTVEGKGAAPGDVTTFVYSSDADGTRRFTFTMDPIPVDIAGWEIRWYLGATSDWSAMTALVGAGVLRSSPYETNELNSGSYTFAIKAKDTSGNESSNALFVNAVLPDPRIADALFTSNEEALGWPGSLKNGFVAADNTIWANSSETINDLPGEISIGSPGLADSISTLGINSSPVEYTTQEIDLGADVVFRPVLTVDADGAVTTTMQYGTDAEGSADGPGSPSNEFGAVETVTARYIKIMISVAGSDVHIRSMALIIDAPSKTEEFPDVDTSTETATWFESLAAGHFRIATKGGLSTITIAKIVAIQNVGEAFTAELVTKNAEITSGGGQAAEFKLRNSSGVLADATVDVELKGPRSTT
jgi:hypothetical protein